jgi:LysM repeat protein
MTTPRKVSKNQFVSFLGLNVLVSAVTVLIVLAIWDRGHQLPEVMPTPTFDVVARLNDSIPTATATIPPTPTPVTYTVKGGDTLGQIAAELDVSIESLMAANGLQDPNTLSAGQVLVVPIIEGDDQQQAAVSTPIVATSTPEPAGETSQVVIKGAYQSGDIETEYVYLQNTGGVAAMEGWTLEDGQGHVFIFPAFTLYRNGGVNVYTQDGVDSVINLFWGLDEPIWFQGSTITLRETNGAVHSTFEIPES